MSKEKQIDYKEFARQMRQTATVFNGTEPAVVCSKELWEYIASMVESFAGYQKQSEGEWVFEAHYFYDDYGDLCIYATAKCSECKKAYTNPHSTVASMRVSRPENLSEYDDWEVDVEPFLTEILEMARARKDLSKFCPNCGAHMKGGAE